MDPVEAPFGHSGPPRVIEVIALLESDELGVAGVQLTEHPLETPRPFKILGSRVGKITRLGKTVRQHVPLEEAESA